MPANTESRGGLFYGWNLGESGWDEEMNENLVLLSRLAVPNLSVLDRDLTAPPGSPSDGDAYIVAGSATGDWTSHDDDIAIWDDDAEEWVFYTPKIGWACVIIDEEVLSMFNSGGWSTGAAL